MTAILAIWHDVDPAVADAYDAWYDEEHFPERLGCPGFINGQRYVAVSAATTPRYLSFYEVAGLDSLAAGEYRRRLENPTPRTTRVIAGFRNSIRGACTVHLDAGAGHGAYCATLVLDATVPMSVIRAGVDALAQASGVLRVRVIEGDASATGPMTAEQLLRGAPDRAVPLTAIVDADDRAVLPGIERLPHASDVVRGEYRRLRFAIAPGR